jgi:RNA polymerase sigma-70 factor, ECF subfamily
MPSWDNVDDVQLLKSAQDGETDAFGELYERYALKVFRFLFSRLDNRLDAEDLTEDVFLRVWRSLPRYDEKGVPFSAFVFRIANNALIDHYRRNNKYAPEVNLESVGILDSESDPEGIAYHNLEHEELRQILGQLREDYRNVLVLRFLSDLTSKETAQAMDRSVGAVRILQHRALDALRGLLEGQQFNNNGRV